MSINTHLITPSIRNHLNFVKTFKVFTVHWSRVILLNTKTLKDLIRNFIFEFYLTLVEFEGVSTLIIQIKILEENYFSLFKKQYFKLHLNSNHGIVWKIILTQKTKIFKFIV